MSYFCVTIITKLQFVEPVCLHVIHNKDKIFQPCNMSEPLATDSGSSHEKGDNGKVSYITLDDDTDTGDSEFEPTGGSGIQDDDSIAADEDVADEEEVNGLMRVDR